MILQALAEYYDRMARSGEAVETGWAKVPVEWVIELSPEGEPVAVQQLLDTSTKKPKPRQLVVPAPVNRTVAVSPNCLWDKTSYSLGRKLYKKEPSEKDLQRTIAENSAFIDSILKLTGESKDKGLRALRSFVENWKPSRFDSPPFKAEMLDANIVFRLTGDQQFIHERPAARALISSQSTDDTKSSSMDTCLITGKLAPPARLHPIIKGVNGAQSSGASLVSFNLDAFESYGREQGANSPVSELSAQKYGAALNALLARGSRNRLPRGIGDATVVFWADAATASEESAANAAQDLFLSIFAPDESDEIIPEKNTDSDASEAAKLRDALQEIAEGRPAQIYPRLTPGVRFHVLGLAPNAARIAVRFWMSDSFEHFISALLRHMQDVEIDPPPRFWSGKKGPPEVWRLLVKTTAVQEKFENVPPQLAGDLTRSILTATPYPRTWLTNAIMRLRSGDPPDSGWHAAAVKACINRNPYEENLPVALDLNNTNQAYLLGRLFAVLEAAQKEALGKKVNATIVDRYYASASSTPARVFPTLLRGARVHISDVLKQNKGFWIEKRLDSIIGKLGAEFPTTLRLEDQGRFAVGYYHERAYRGDTDGNSNTEDSTTAPSEELLNA